jgi:hypothetical protein
MPIEAPTPDNFRSAIKEELAFIERVLKEPVPGKERLSAGLGYASLKRAANVLRGVEVVAREGLVSEIRTLGRVICESAYNAMWILEHDGKDLPPDKREENAQWLMDHAVLEGAKTMRGWGKCGYAPQEKVDEANEAEARVRERRGLGPKDDMRNPNLYERAVQAGGKALEENYALFYRPMCLDAHPTIQAMMWAIEGQGDYEAGKALFMVFASAVTLIDACCQLMGRTDFPPVKTALYKNLNLPESVPASAAKTT